MKIIKVSDEVWNEIAQRGKFGETEEDVLRRVFGLASTNKEVNMRRKRVATDTLHPEFQDEKHYKITFDSGREKVFPLPDKTDREGVKELTDKVMRFVKDAGATIGQINAARKALTDRGYLIRKW
jgi:negative regulator of replication initiation